MSAHTPAAPIPPAAQRLMSLDALRGFDMFWILGADSFVYALHGMSQNAVTKFLATQLDHAEWAGFYFYDLIFPLFVFMMGVSTVFSLTRIIEREGRAAAVRRVLRRGVLLFIVALIYSGGFTNPWPDMRLLGVLNRISLCYTAGALLFIFFRPRALVAVAVAVLFGYWGLLALTPMRDIHLEKEQLAVLAERSDNPRLAITFQACHSMPRNLPLGSNHCCRESMPPFKTTRAQLANLNKLQAGLELSPGITILEPCLRRDSCWVPSHRIRL